MQKRPLGQFEKLWAFRRDVNIVVEDLEKYHELPITMAVHNVVKTAHQLSKLPDDVLLEILFGAVESEKGAD
jgi:hypothetical protein